MNENDAPVRPALLDAVRAGELDAVRRLIDGGANPRIGDGVDLPLHVAARRGDRAVCELLIASGALVWQPDGSGRSALDVARAECVHDRAAMLALLDRGAIAEPSFRNAVDAIVRGDVDALERALDARPSLLHERNTGPDAYRRAKRHDYFRDPKLFWYVANNPRLAARMPENLVAVAQAMLRRGVDPGDVDYALELVMSSAALREQGLQRPLMRALLDAGARPLRRALHVAAAYRELDAVREALAQGVPLTAPLAAALGDEDALARLLAASSREDVQDAFGLAVINHRVGCVRRALCAGADVDAPLPVHDHSTALHQAAGDDDCELIAVLLDHGADAGARDALWDATPLDWARYGRRAAAVDALERIAT